MRATFLIALFLLLPSTVLAEAEISLVAGYRFGGPSLDPGPIFCFSLPCPQNPTVDARDDESLGLIVDIPIQPKLMLEFLVSHQSGEFNDEGLGFLTLFPRNATQRFDLTYLHFGLLRQWDLRRVAPFAAVGLGIVQIDLDRPRYFATTNEERLSASLAGGVKLSINKTLGVRLETRGYWADLPEPLGKDLFQLEVSTGLTFKL